VQPCPLQTQQEPVHWIEIELVGEDGSPIPWEPYTVILSDGNKAEGYLDGDGFTRIGGIESAGSCRISFPGLDRDAWEFVETLAQKAQA